MTRRRLLMLLGLSVFSPLRAPGAPPAAAPVEADETTGVRSIVEEFSGKVISVIDGDTIRVLKADKTDVRVRLEGIDAPESMQDHGAKARQALSDLIDGQEVTVRKTGEDRHGQTLAYVFAGDVELNASMAEGGWAWHVRQHNSEQRFSDLEDSAKAARRGLWSHDRPVPPWDYRALMEKRRVAAKLKQQKPEASATEKVTEKAITTKAAPAAEFWLNTSSNVRHNATCVHFKNTKKGRPSSASEGEACGICGG